ncbi:hypothetical protein [Methanobrevibacter sp.]|nr:hypothetical protein [Methanobrevibacter sp.]MDO5859641.1 hypothetical protein [Methanobrevibacter sp.]
MDNIVLSIKFYTRSKYITLILVTGYDSDDKQHGVFIIAMTNLVSEPTR